MKTSNYKIIGHSSVWDYHNSGSFESLIRNPRTNLHKSLMLLNNDNMLVEGISIIRGGIGRSQHSKTALKIIKGDYPDGLYFSYDELEELLKL